MHRSFVGLAVAALTASLLVVACTGPAGANGVDGTNGKDGTNGRDGAPGTNGANGANGTNGISAWAKTRPEPAGANCPTGGSAIEVGQDTNGNGMLDASEVTSTTYVCNAAAATVVRTDTEPPGVNCALGGVAIRSGKDLNGNGLLEDAEVTQTRYVCGDQPVGTLIEGDVTITNSLDYERFRLAARITGFLSLVNARMGVGSIDFPNLTSVGGLDLRNLPALTSVSFPKLKEQTANLPLRIWSNPQLTQVSLPLFTRKLADLTINSNASLNDCPMRGLRLGFINALSPNPVVTFSGNGTALLDAGTCDLSVSCWQVRPSTPVLPQADGGPPDWVLDGGQTKSWGLCGDLGTTGVDLAKTCAATFDGGRPVKFDGQADLVAFTARTSQFWPGGGSLFLGGGDQLADGGATPDAGWYWADGTPYGFYNWAPGEPNGGNVENCLQFYLGSGLWNDVPCSISMALSCEIP